MVIFTTFILIPINSTIFSTYLFIENNSSILALLVLVPVNSTIFDICLFTQKHSGILTTFRINSSKFDYFMVFSIILPILELTRVNTVTHFNLSRLALNVRQTMSVVG